MKNPFDKHEIKLNLNLSELKLLIKALQSCSPDKSDESTVMNLFIQLMARLKEIESN